MSNYRNDGDVDRLAEMFKALAHPQRLRLFRNLVRCCQPGTACEMSLDEARCCVGDVSRDLDLAASTVSHHLKELRQAGLMRIERRGRRIECRVCEEAVRLLAGFLGGAQGRDGGASCEGGCDATGAGTRAG